MFPHLIIHTGVSLDGRIDWGAAPDSPYYEVISSFKADVDLAGSGTMSVADLPDNPQAVFGEAYEQWMNNASRPMLAVVDSRGLIHNWDLIQKQPWWRKCIALCSEATPQHHLDYLSGLGVETIVAGREKVDLLQALEELNTRYDVQVVRTDCGGVLHGALLRAGLVDEVSVIINPTLVGGMTPRTMFVAPDLVSEDDVVHLKLLHLEKLKEQYVWLRYQVCKMKNSEDIAP